MMAKGPKVGLSITWKGGVVVKYRDLNIAFDPIVEIPQFTHVFVSHAHFDHSKGLCFQGVSRFTTPETKDLIMASRRWNIEKVENLLIGEKIRLDDLEVQALNSGHILGSCLFRLYAPEGTCVYTGDLNFSKTLITEPAEVAPCDILVIEATFGSPQFSFPSRDLIYRELVDWAIGCILKGKVPALRADAIGNSQELISIFNRFTEIPIVTEPSVTRINRVYESYGFRLNYVPSKSLQGAALLASRKCILIAPKNIDLSYNPTLKPALASGLSMVFGGSGERFPLSDHADFPHLLEYVASVKPKIVYTHHGGRLNETLARLIERRLGIEAKPLPSEP
ncbi:MAG: MBL fold metallo-hydrolase [Candidatus Bathyarchaeia archaeon]